MKNTVYIRVFVKTDTLIFFFGKDKRAFECVFAKYYYICVRFSTTTTYWFIDIQLLQCFVRGGNKVGLCIFYWIRQYCCPSYQVTMLLITRDRLTVISFALFCNLEIISVFLWRGVNTQIWFKGGIKFVFRFYYLSILLDLKFINSECSWLIYVTFQVWFQSIMKAD